MSSRFRKNVRRKVILERKILHTDVLIIGGGTAGCFCAYTIGKEKKLSVIIAEKANIKRSGCLAAGVNAINAYIVKGQTPMDYVNYATNDANQIARKDLLLSMSERLNEVTKEMEKLGLVLLKDENKEYVNRGNRNIKINGENFKPILAKAVQDLAKVEIINQLNITELLVKEGRVYGAIGFHIEREEFYEIRASYVLIATGGAAGLYRPNNPGFSRHKMWYPPFNTGAGFHMGFQAGAEMTTFEMRFIALRCKDTIAPTGTIAQGVGAKQINGKGENIESVYGLKTSERVYGSVVEEKEGRGPIYLQTTTMQSSQEEELLKAYLNMAPSQTLRWIEQKKGPLAEDVEITGTEPYIVGGHTASGFWVDTNRKTTIEGLYAAGDVAGGCPQKYVTGALAEGQIVAEHILEESKKMVSPKTDVSDSILEEYIRGKKQEYESRFGIEEGTYSIEQVEEAMQKVMDEYAGGKSTGYQYTSNQLNMAKEKIEELQSLAKMLAARDMHELMFIRELEERMTVCLLVIAHLQERKETRWHSFNEYANYPNQDPNFELYINSIQKEGKLQMKKRPLVKEEVYEHQD